MNIRKSYYLTFFTFFLFVNFDVSAAANSGSDFNATITSTVNIDANFTPNSWVRVSGVSIPTHGNQGRGVTGCNTLWSSGLCIDAQANVGGAGRGEWNGGLSFYQRNVQDSKGRNFSFAVAFPYGAPVLHLFEYYKKTYWVDDRIYNSTFSFSSSNYPVHPDETGKYNYEISTGEKNIGSCGDNAASNGCTLYQLSYFDTSTSNPVLYIKLPPNLTGGEVISFTGLELMTLHHKHKGSAGWVTLTPRKLIVSVNITIPQQRCYLSVEGASALNFGGITASDTNGRKSSQTGFVKSECFFSTANSRQYLKIEPVSGGTLSQDQFHYKFNNDKNGNPALGIAFGIGYNSSLSCSNLTENKNKFNTEYLIRNLVGQEREVYTDAIQFSLCKYGVPATNFGTQTIGIKVTSRWE